MGLVKTNGFALLLIFVAILCGKDSLSAQQNSNDNQQEAKQTPVPLTQADRIRLAQLVSNADVDGDGKVTREELRNLLKPDVSLAEQTQPNQTEERSSTGKKPNITKPNETGAVTNDDKETDRKPRIRELAETPGIPQFQGGPIHCRVYKNLNIIVLSGGKQDIETFEFMLADLIPGKKRPKKKQLGASTTKNE